MAMIRIVSLILTLALTACIHWPDIERPGGCESYGVVETGQPAGDLREALELPQHEIDRVCDAESETSLLTDGQRFAGCTRRYSDGMVGVYWRVGDQAARFHEFCHLKHGPGHTSRFTQDVANNHPMPHAPVNQLKGLTWKPKGESNVP